MPVLAIMLAAGLLPARTRGQERFWYRWGADRAHIETEEWPIAYSPILGG